MTEAISVLLSLIHFVSQIRVMGVPVIYIFATITMLSLILKMVLRTATGGDQWSKDN